MRKFFRSVVAGPGRGGGAAEGFGLYIADDAVLRHHLRPGLFGSKTVSTVPFARSARIGLLDAALIAQLRGFLDRSGVVVAPLVCEDNAVRLIVYGIIKIGILFYKIDRNICGGGICLYNR